MRPLRPSALYPSHPCPTAVLTDAGNELQPAAKAGAIKGEVA